MWHSHKTKQHMKTHHERWCLDAVFQVAKYMVSCSLVSIYHFGKTKLIRLKIQPSCSPFTIIKHFFQFFHFWRNQFWALRATARRLMAVKLAGELDTSSNKSIADTPVLVLMLDPWNTDRYFSSCMDSGHSSFLFPKIPNTRPCIISFLLGSFIKSAYSRTLDSSQVPLRLWPSISFWKKSYCVF